MKKEVSTRIRRESSQSQSHHHNENTSKNFNAFMMLSIAMSLYLLYYGMELTKRIDNANANPNQMSEVLSSFNSNTNTGNDNNDNNNHNNGKVPGIRIVDKNNNNNNNKHKPLRYDSSNATVMSMAQGYKLWTYQWFVGSLRKSGFTGTIILAVQPDLEPQIEEYLLSKKVTILKLTYVECDNPIVKKGDQKAADQVGKKNLKEANTCIAPYSDIKIRWGRYPFFRDALKECEACTGPVFVTDARDVFFQRDPFGDGAEEVEGFQFFAEQPTLIDASNWFVAKRVRECKDGYAMEGPQLCSGTTIGTRETMMDFLDIMYNEMKLWMNTTECIFHSHGGDQAIMNYLYYSGQFNKINPTVYYPRQGTVNTVGVIGMSISKHLKNMKPGKINRVTGSRNWLPQAFDLIDRKGYFIEYDGSRSRIVHQADRFTGWWLRWMHTGVAWKDGVF